MHGIFAGCHIHSGGSWRGDNPVYDEESLRPAKTGTTPVCTGFPEIVLPTEKRFVFAVTREKFFKNIGNEEIKFTAEQDGIEHDAGVEQVATPAGGRCRGRLSECSAEGDDTRPQGVEDNVCSGRRDRWRSTSHFHFEHRSDAIHSGGSRYRR